MGFDTIEINLIGFYFDFDFDFHGHILCSKCYYVQYVQPPSCIELQLRLGFDTRVLEKKGG